MPAGGEKFIGIILIVAVALVLAFMAGRKGKKDAAADK